MPNSWPKEKKKVMPDMWSMSTVLIIRLEAMSAGYASQRGKLGGLGVFQIMGVFQKRGVYGQTGKSSRSSPFYKAKSTVSI
jgi:hypothetical protein